MKYDIRYGHVKSIWISGNLTSFTRIFDIVPKSVVAKDMGLHYHSLSNKLTHLGLFDMGNLLNLSELTGVPLTALFELLITEIRTK